MEKGKKIAKPYFVHDCKCCVYYGSVKNHNGRFDMYVNNEGYLVRFGNEGGEYSSYPDIAVVARCMNE